MSKAGVEKSVWYIMDGDFVVDATDLRRDAKYYADKWNAAEKYSKGVTEGITPNTIHKLADRKGVKWDNEPSFLQLTKRITGKEHLDDLDQAELRKVKQHLEKQGVAEEQLDELKCWSGYTRVQGVPAGAPGSCKKKTNEEQEEKCPHCSGPMFSEMIMNEKKDACYYKVKSRYKVWPSAYASGALVKCRKSGADSWGNGGKKNESIEESVRQFEDSLEESLHDWFNKEKWVRMDTKGKIKGPCAREPGEGKPKCLPQSKAHSLGKKGRASAAQRKRREDPNPERSGKAINVNTKKKTNESFEEQFEMKINQLITEVENVNEDWNKVNKKDKTSGMSQKAVNAYRRENPGSKLKTAVTTKPSKIKKGSKDASRRKSFCARMGGMKKHNASAKTKRDPDSPINKALRRWNCESIEEMEELVMIAEQKLNEAKNPAQQAAIAINMKKNHKKPKTETISEDYIEEK
jgi:hypothetical protein